MIWGDVGKYGSKRETAKDPEKKTGPNTFIHILTISSIAQTNTWTRDNT
jgi:hypothetical protein